MLSNLVLSIAVFQERHGIHSPCDFIFDEHIGFSLEALRSWPQIKSLLENSARSDLGNFVGSPPIFRDEKQFLPLQAADLYAWQVRNHYLANHRMKNQTIRFPRNRTLQMLWPIGAINREFSTAEVIRLRDHLLMVGKKFAEDHPSVPLLPPIEDKRERQKAHRNARRPKPETTVPASSLDEPPC
jgi:hypothetical protein